MWYGTLWKSIQVSCIYSLELQTDQWKMALMKKSFSCLPLGGWFWGTLPITQKIQVVLTESINWLSSFPVLLSFVSHFYFLNHFSNYLHVPGSPFWRARANKKGIFKLSWASGPLALLQLLVPFIFCFLTWAYKGNYSSISHLTILSEHDIIT